MVPALSRCVIAAVEKKDSWAQKNSYIVYRKLFKTAGWLYI